MNHHSSLVIGTRLLRPKCLGIIQHEGVFVGRNAVLHNTPEKGEHVSSLEEFAAGHPVQIQSTDVSSSLVLIRAQQVLSSPRGYNLLRRNCQHTASEIIRGIGRSPLVVGGVMALVFLLGIWAVRGLSRKA